MNFNLQAIEKECEDMYVNPNGASPSEVVKGLYEAKEMETLGAARFVLDNSVNPYAQQMAVRCFRCIILHKWKLMEDANAIAGIQSYLFGLLTTKGGRELASTVALLLVKRWAYAIDKVPKEEGSTFMKAYVDEIRVRPTHLSTLLPMMDVFKSSTSWSREASLFLTMKQYGLVHGEFVSDILPDIAEIAYANLPQYPSICVSLLIAVFGFTDYGEEGDFYMFMVKTSMTSPKYDAIIDAPELYTGLMAMYAECGGNVEVVSLLHQIVGRLTIRSDTESKVRVLRCAEELLRNQGALGKRDVHHAVCLLMSKIMTAGVFAIDELKEEFVAALAGFTVSSFRAHGWAPHSLHYLIQIWGSRQRNWQKRVKPYAGEILTAYLQARLGAAGDEGGAVQKQFGLETDAVYHLMSVDHKVLFPIVMAAFDAAATETQVVWMLAIVSPILAKYVQYSYDANIDESESQDIMINILNRAYRIVTVETSSLVMNKAVLRFLQVFNTQCVTDEGDKRYFEKLAPTCPHFKTAKDASLFVLHKLFYYLENPNIDASLLKRATELLFGWSHVRDEDGHGRHMIEMDKEVMSRLFAIHATIFSRHQNNVALYRVRRHFYQSIMNFATEGSQPPSMYIAILQSFSERIANVVNGTTSDRFSVMGMLVDLRGVAELRWGYRMYVKFYKWLVPYIQSLCMLIVQFDGCLDVVGAVTKLLIEIVKQFMYHQSSTNSKTSFFPIFEPLARAFGNLSIIASRHNDQIAERVKIHRWMLQLWNALMCKSSYMDAIRHFSEGDFCGMMNIALGILQEAGSIAMYARIAPPMYAMIHMVYNLAPEFLLRQLPHLDDALGRGFGLATSIYIESNNHSDYDSVCTLIVSYLMRTTVKMPDDSNRAMMVERMRTLQRPVLDRFLRINMNVNRGYNNKMLYNALRVSPQTAAEQFTRAAIRYRDNAAMQIKRRWFLDMLTSAQSGHSYKEFMETVVPSKDSTTVYTLKDVDIF
jgi:hypothetical protein